MSNKPDVKSISTNETGSDISWERWIEGTKRVWANAGYTFFRVTDQSTRVIIEGWVSEPDELPEPEWD